jgi:ubiquinone/menaquinone biosynthesis C-methylase UbiE
MTLEEIESYWTAQAREHGVAPAASWSDVWAIDLEVREIARRLADGDRVLDVGCANGFSTVRIAARRRVHVRGIDYVPGMIERARQQLAKIERELQGEVEFGIGNVLELNEPENAYDKVVCVRVLINLRTWENQRRALGKLARVLRPGGTLLLSEATEQGLDKLNRLRAEFGLDPLPVPSFNEYVDVERLVEAARPEMELVELVDFASSYYVGTRVLKPLLARLGLARIEVADPETEWNRLCAQLPAWGDYGTQKLFVLRKTGG